MKKKEKDINEQLNSNAVPFQVFGKYHIEEAAMHQMYLAARLPITVAGALMPDAHSGYGLNIEMVMESQHQLVDIVGKFIPTIVRMDGDSGRARKWK